MSEEGSNNGDDLTTDAIPSAPRNQKPNTEHSASPRGSAKSNSSSKRKKPSGFTNVINISNANGIHIGANYNVYLNKEGKEEARIKDFVITPTVSCLFASKEPVTKQHIRQLSAHIDDKWKDTARFLNYSDGQISQLWENYKESGLKEVIYKFLLDWIENEADEATVGKLSTALWENRQQESVVRWSKNFI